MIPLLIHLPLILFLVYRLQKYSNGNLRIFWFAFFIKLFAGWCLGALYLYYYSANDTWLLYEEAQKLSAVFRTDTTRFFSLLWFDDSEVLQSLGLISQDRSLFFIRVIAILNIIGLNSYWVVSAYCSLIAFTAAWHLHHQVSLFTGQTVASAIAFLFCPSVVFWSSGIIKETLALAGIFVLAAVLISWVHHKRLIWWQVVLLFPAFYVAWGLKYYWAAVFVGASVSVFLFYQLNAQFKWMSSYRFPLWLLLFVMFIFGASLVHPNFYIERFLEVVVSNHDLFVQVSNSEDIIHYSHLNKSWWSLILNSPLALASALFRPFVWEASGWTGAFAAIENLVLLIFFLVALRNIPILGKSPHRVLAWGVIAYILVLAIFLALSTPNFGTLSRYRVGFLPFFVFLILVNSPLVDWLRAKFKI